jgi:chromosome partitioning protein
MAYTIAISNQKGGVAKTTSCLSLGASLAGLGWRTLVVDLDPQAHLTLATGLKAEDLPMTMADLLDGSGSVPNAANAPRAYPTCASGLEILPADLRLARLERELYGRPEYERCLAEALQPWQAYDFILLDCPPSMGALTVMALSAAHRALIPVQCDYFSSQGVIQLLEIIEAVKEHTNPSLAYFIFVTLFDRRNLVSRTVLEQLRIHFPESLLEIVIGLDTRLRECAIAGEPVTVYAPKTRASQQYHGLAVELVDRIEKNGGMKS